MDGDGDNPQDRHIHDYYAFTMCNPPFYSSVEEMSDRSMQKSSFNINSAKLLPTSASHNELVTDGGEVGFIGKMIKESRMQVIGGKVGWFTTLVGIKSNYEELRRRLNSDTEVSGFLFFYIYFKYCGSIFLILLSQRLNRSRLDR